MQAGRKGVAELVEATNDGEFANTHYRLRSHRCIDVAGNLNDEADVHMIFARKCRNWRSVSLYCYTRMQKGCCFCYVEERFRLTLVDDMDWSDSCSEADP